MARRRPRIRIHPNWPMISMFIGLTAACALYLVVSLWAHRGGRHSIEEVLLPRCLELFVLAWFFWFGSSIGSFLNVVAWRMPRNRSINGFSACPFCAVKIKAYDNVPVFGWLNLRGRCRSCRLPIAARYPIVEALVGVSIMLVGVTELYFAGTNLPGNPAGAMRLTSLRMPQIPPMAIGICIYHIVALTGSWALALVRIDGFRLPGRLVAFFLACLVIPLFVWPNLQMVTWRLNPLPQWDHKNYVSVLVFLIAAVVAASLIARVIGRHACPAADPKLDPLGKDTSKLIDLILVLLIPGVVFGWHGLIAVSLIAIVAAMVLRRKYPGPGGYAWLLASVPWALALHLVFWKSLNGLSFWPSPGASPGVILAWLAGILILAADLREQQTTAEEEAQDVESDEECADTPAPLAEPSDPQ